MTRATGDLENLADRVELVLASGNHVSEHAKFLSTLYTMIADRAHQWTPDTPRYLRALHHRKDRWARTVTDTLMSGE